MPSSKKKKEKNVDFTKAKLKLGKGKKPANNAVDTSFKARSIAVPLQSIGLDKNASNPTTRRNQTLDDLLLHLKHYNANTRKEAITGLRELLEAHPVLIEGSLTTVLHACARVISDEDGDVRKLLISLFTWLLRTLPAQKVQPHVQFLMLFITSAQTNIFPAIRIDAIRFIDVLLELVPEVITQNWLQPDTTGSRILEGYLGLLSTSSKLWSGSQDDGPGPSTASVTLSTNSRLTVLSSLATFLEKALLPTEMKQISIVPKWILAPYFSSEQELHAFCSLVYPCRTDNHLSKAVAWDDNQEGTFVGSFGNYCCIEQNTDMWLSSDEIGELMQGSISSSKQGIRPDAPQASHLNSSSNSQSSHLVQLARTLQPILTTTWLEVAPLVFAPSFGRSGNETETLLAITVMRILGCLYGAIIRNGDISESSREIAGDDLYSLLSHISPYLPNMTETSDLQLEEFIRSMSFSYCELASLTAIACIRPNAATNSAAHQKRDRGLSVQLERVGKYIVTTLDGQFRPSSRATVLSTSSYIALLPTLWHLLVHRSNNSVLSDILSACINHSILLPSKSGLKAPSTQFIGIFTLLCNYRNNSSLLLGNLTPNEIERLKEWYLQLPKTLWEVGNNDPGLTEVILLLLLRIPQRHVPLFDQTTHLAVMSRLIPYFTVIHPQKGKLPGPFNRLKSFGLKKLALDVAKSMLYDYGTAAAQFRASVEHSVMDMKDVSFWLSYLSS